MIHANTQSTEAGVTLAPIGRVRDETLEDFKSGNHLSNYLTPTHVTASGVQINQGYMYTKDTIPELLTGTYTTSIVHDGAFLYIGTQAGLSVINTQGTTDPSDDILVTRYHTGSTPALASNTILTFLVVTTYYIFLLKMPAFL